MVLPTIGHIGHRCQWNNTAPESLRDTVNGWMQGYKVIYGFFNLILNQSHSVCMWQGATALDMLAFKYVTVLYALLLIVAVIWIMNKCGGRCLGKVCQITAIKISVVHGISTFLVICYAQCIKVSLSLLIPVNIHIEESSKFKAEPRVWLNRNILYFSNQHLRYALPALFLPTYYWTNASSFAIGLSPSQ